MWPSESRKIKVELFQIWKKTSLHQSADIALLATLFLFTFP